MLKRDQLCKGIPERQDWIRAMQFPKEEEDPFLLFRCFENFVITSMTLFDSHVICYY